MEMIQEDSQVDGTKWAAITACKLSSSFARRVLIINGK